MVGESALRKQVPTSKFGRHFEIRKKHAHQFTHCHYHFMKKNLSFIPGLAVAMIASAILSFNSTARAQADNPHLRRTSPTPGAAAAQSTLAPQDQTFLLTAASSGAQIIQDGMVAEKKAKSAETRKVASRVVASHETSNKDLIALAKRKGLAVTTDNIKPRDMGTQNYDAQYLYSIETDHQQDLKAFNDELKNGKDAEVKAWASQHLPTVKEDLAMAKKARKELK
jgi:putative membrane protein